MCQIFASSLGKTTYAWYDKLQVVSFDSSKWLANKFIERVIANSKRAKGLDTLMALKKTEDYIIK